MKVEINIDIDQLKTEIVQDVVKALKPLLVKGRPEDDPLMTLEECSKYLGVKEQWLYKRVSFKEIPYIKAGRFLKFKKSEIDRWLEDNSIPQVNPLSSSLKVVR